MSVHPASSNWNGMRVRRNLEPYGKGALDDIVVVVVRCSLRTDGDDTVLSALILFEGELLPVCRIIKDKERGCMIQACGGEPRCHLSRECEGFGIIDLRQEDGGIVLSKLISVRVTEVIGLGKGMEDDGVILLADLRDSTIQ